VKDRLGSLLANGHWCRRRPSSRRG